eukprot:30155_1
MWVCDICSHSFVEKISLQRHILAHQNIKQFECDICEQKFAQRSSLKIHISTQHTNEKRYFCEFCNRGYFRKDCLTLHRNANHLNTRNGSKQCSKLECMHRRFRTHEALAVHEKLHESTSALRCPMCNSPFANNLKLNKHRARCRNREVSYKCNCGKSFVSKSDLKNHSIVHSGERKFACGMCDVKVFHQSSLSRHYQLKHPGVPVSL